MSTNGAAVGASEPAGEASPRRQRVLVVDDEDLVRLVVARTLRRAGFDVFEARDGLDALSALSTVVPDLVLTDLNMPRCNGERLCIEIARRPGTAGIRLVMMTGGPLDEAHMRALGCEAVIYKPLPDRLADLIAAILQGGTPASRPGAWAVLGRGPQHRSHAS